MVTRSEPGYAWDFCGGHLALDFVNTIGSRGGARDEHLRAWDDVLSWAVARGVVSRRAAARSHREISHKPPVARRALAGAIELREALHDVFAAAAARPLRRRTAPPAGQALTVVNAWIAATFARARIAYDGRRFALSTADADATGVDLVARPIVRAAVDLLTSPDLSRVRACADRECAWLFLDTTRNRTRRWCDMTVCGNRDKVRRFRANRA